MKGNNGTGNIIERDLWETPQWLWDILDNQYKFNFDCCASIINHKCNDFSSNLKNEYTKWQRMCWMNPPFSKASEMFKHFFRIIDQGIAIYRCDNMETKIWQEVILPNASWIFIPNKRWAYEGMEGKGSRFPSALIGYNVPEPKGLDGVTLTAQNKKVKDGNK